MGEIFTGSALAIMGAVLSALLGGIGSAKGVQIAGEAAAGVTAENPDSFGKVLVLQALPGTQGIYGFLIAFIVMLKINLIGGMIQLTQAQGLMLLAGCVPVAVIGLLSGIYQGKTAAAAIGLVARRPDQSGKGIVMTVMVETYAVLGLLASFLLVWFAI